MPDCRKNVGRKGADVLGGSLIGDLPQPLASQGIPTIQSLFETLSHLEIPSYNGNSQIKIARKVHLDFVRVDTCAERPLGSSFLVKTVEAKAREIANGIGQHPGEVIVDSDELNREEPPEQPLIDGKGQVAKNREISALRKLKRIIILTQIEQSIPECTLIPKWR